MKAVLDRVRAAPPERPVLVNEAATLSYGDLLRSAHELARDIDKFSRPGSPVALCLDNGPDFLVTLIGTWTAERVPLVPFSAPFWG